MNYERPELEKGSKKFICPQCNHKTLKLYIQYGKYINNSVGICDRIINCGYHKPPKEWFNENPTDKEQHTPILYHKQIIPITQDKIKPIGYVPFNYIYDKAETRNHNLIYYLLDLFNWETIKERTDVYFLGCTDDKATIFPQIDEDGNCRTAKIQQYDKDTGKRIKNSVKWVHDKLKKCGELPNDYNLKMCLFGLHLIRSLKNTGKIIGICESEKSAVIAACCMPEYIWMAAGALNWLNAEKLKPLKGWNVILFPDTSINGKAFDIWAKIAIKANKLDLNVTVSELLEKNCTEAQKAKGYDLGDYLIDRLLSVKQSILIPKEPINKPPEPQKQSTILSDMISRNPALGTLINSFNLIQV